MIMREPHKPSMYCQHIGRGKPAARTARFDNKHNQPASNYLYVSCRLRAVDD